MILSELYVVISVGMFIINIALLYKTWKEDRK